MLRDQHPSDSVWPPELNLHASLVCGEHHIGNECLLLFAYCMEGVSIYPLLCALEEAESSQYLIFPNLSNSLHVVQ